MASFPPDLLDEFARWLVAAARFGGALSLIPGLSARYIPTPARAAVAFGAALSGVARVAPISPDRPVVFLALLLKEFAVGMLIGFTFAAFVWLIGWVASLVDWQVGFGFSATVDPITNTRVSLVGRAGSLIAGLLFFQLGAHHWLLRALAGSYDWVPVGATLHLRPQLGDAWMHLVERDLLLVLPFALPAMGAVLLVDIILGAMGRAAPQLAVLLWGMPVRIATGVFVVAASFTALPALSERLLGHINETCPVLLNAIR